MPDDRADLPAPYELEAPVDDLALCGAALGVAALLTSLVGAVLPGLVPVGWLLGTGGLVVSGLAVRRRSTARRAAVVGVGLSAAALLVLLLVFLVVAVAALLAQPHPAAGG